MSGDGCGTIRLDHVEVVAGDRDDSQVRAMVAPTQCWIIGLLVQFRRVPTLLVLRSEEHNTVSGHDSQAF